MLFPNPESVQGIVALQWDHASLWVSTRGGGLGDRDPAWEYLIGTHTNAALWRLPGGGGALESIPLAVPDASEITSLCVQSSNLWLTMQQDGVACLNLRTREQTLYGDRQGVLSRQMFASAVMGDRLYFGGGEPNNGKLNFVETPGRVWKGQNLPGASQIKLLASFGGYLAVDDQLLQVDTGAERPIRDLFPSEATGWHNPWRAMDVFAALAATSDASGFWVGTTVGLTAYNPNTQAKRTWLGLYRGFLVDTNAQAYGAVTPPVRLPGAVTALANEGDFLWVGATTRFVPTSIESDGSVFWTNGYYMYFTSPTRAPGGGGHYGGWLNAYNVNERSYVLLLHKPTGKWVGYFEVTNRVTSLAAGDGRLWVGLETAGYAGDFQEYFLPSPLLQVQTSPLLATPPSQWVANEPTPAELNTQMQAAAEVLKNSILPPEETTHSILERRDDFLQKNFSRFIPVKLERGADGAATLQHLATMGNQFAYGDSYFCGFRFTLPAWFDGDLEWLFALDKTAAQKDWTYQGLSWFVLPESGRMDGICDYHNFLLENYPQLQRQLPYTQSMFINDWDQDQFTAGKTYAVWFCTDQPVLPDLAFALTIHSARGTNEIGPLPLR